MAPSKITLFSRIFILAALLAAVPFGVKSPLAQEPKTATERLFQAVRNNDLGTTQESVAAGGDINATNAWGVTPVDLAVDKGFFDIAHFLLSIRNQEQLNETAPPPAPPAPPQVKSAPVQPSLPPPSPAVETAEPAWPKGKPNPFDPDALPANPFPPIVEDGPGRSPVLITRPEDDLPEGVAEAAPKETPRESEPDEAPVLPAPAREEPPALAAREAEDGDDGGDSSVSRFFSRISDFISPGAETDEADKTDEAAATPETASVKDPSQSTEIQPEDLPDPLASPSPDPEETSLEDNDEAALKAAKTDEAPPGEEPSPESNNDFFDGIARFFSPDDETPKTEDMAPERETPANEPALAIPPRALPLPTPVKEEPLEEPSMEKTGETDDRKEEKVQGLLDKLAGFLTSDETGESGKTTETTDDGPADDGPASDAPEAQWAVKKVKTAEKTKTASPLPPGEKDPEKPKAQYLKGNILALGRTLKLGRTRKDRVEPDTTCIEKNRAVVAFCIDAVDWPETMREYFDISSVLYNGTKAIARYDGSAATNFHALFPSAAFEKIVAYYTKRYGDPTFTLKRSIAPLAQPRRENPTVIWRSADPLTKQFTSLEIRKFDDSRGGFPDTRRGAVMLYRQWSLPIFPHLSTIELMILNSSS